MPRPGNNLHVPLPERAVLLHLLSVKPNATMPRPGAHPTGKPKKATTERAKPKK